MGHLYITYTTNSHNLHGLNSLGWGVEQNQEHRLASGGVRTHRMYFSAFMLSTSLLCPGMTSGGPQLTVHDWWVGG